MLSLRYVLDHICVILCDFGGPVKHKMKYNFTSIYDNKLKLKRFYIFSNKRKVLAVFNQKNIKFKWSICQLRLLELTLTRWRLNINHHNFYEFLIFLGAIKTEINYNYILENFL